MHVCAIISEYDPLHKGHEKQLRLIRQQLGEDTAIVCLMSGNFTQRGMPAVFDKTVRARAAVEAGADLVLELPVTKVLSSAEGFARGGVEILDRLGVADHLCFGCESGDIQKIKDTAEILCKPDFTEAFQANIRCGLSYAAARQRALESLSGDGTLLRNPNDILAVEYCKALLERKSRIEPMAVLREGDYHDEAPDTDNPSATAVRARMEEVGDWRPYVPDACIPVYEQAARHTFRVGERALLARLRGMDDDEWQNVPHGGEGLWSKVMKAARQGGSVEEILAAAKSKRYPQTRLQRLVMCAYLGITQEDLQRPIGYVRALAFNDTGSALLKQAKKNGSIPVVNAGEKPEDTAFYAMECRAARLYGLFAENADAVSDSLEEKIRIYKK